MKQIPFNQPPNPPNLKRKDKDKNIHLWLKLEKEHLAKQSPLRKSVLKYISLATPNVLQFVILGMGIQING